MALEIENEICRLTDADSVIDSTSVQSLWSGYGAIKRYFLKGGNVKSVIAKHVQLPKEMEHPKGWNTDFSHQRKLKSYQVEKHWYTSYANRTSDTCKVPTCFQAIERQHEVLLIMEDLNASGYHIRLVPNIVTIADAKNCLKWLAFFHAEFMEVQPVSLWSTGTYWHLDTRPDEFEKMTNSRLKNVANEIGLRLDKAKFQTLVHGDAKLANFCFNSKGQVAAVDFQYVGKGCGIKDVAYFISSCFDEVACEKYEEELLDYYFNQLEIALTNHSDFESVKKEWLDLYKYAWADFYRFLNGWSPGHWKAHGYSWQLTLAAIKEIEERG